MNEPESPNNVPYQAYRSKRHSRNVSLTNSTNSRPPSFISEKQQPPVTLVPPSPPASPPAKTSSPVIEVVKPAEEYDVPNGSYFERHSESKPEPELQSPEPEPEEVKQSKPNVQPEFQTAVASTSTASSSSTPPSPSAELRPSPRKSSTFRRVVPRKTQSQSSVKGSPLAVRQNAPVSPSPLSQTTSPVIVDERPLPPVATSESQAPPELAMPQPIQPVPPPPRTSSLAAFTTTNAAVVTTPSPPIVIPTPTLASQPSSPTRASPGPLTPAKQKSAPKRAPYRPGFQPIGSKRPRTDEFLAARRVARDGAESGVGRKRMERTKLERRLEKLIALHFPDGKEARPPVPERRSSSLFDVSLSDLRSASGTNLWKNVVGGNAKNDIRAAEQRITPWQEDSEVTKCPICSSSFHPLSNRKHHCRLCGQIICNLPVKNPTRPTPCSLLFVVDPKTRKIEEVGEGVDYGVRRRTPSHDKSKEEEEEKFLKGVRICRDCRPVLLRQQYLRDITVAPPFMRLYDVFVALEKEIEDSLPQFQEMVLSLGQDAGQHQGISKEATATRKRLLDAFAQYDALAKRIRALPDDDGKAVKPGSSQDRVRSAILSRANIFLQKNMFPLQSLPKQSSTSSTPTSSTPPPEGANALAIDVDSQMAHVLQPLLEQEALLETFVEEATAQRKFEDAKTLRANLKEIRNEIDRIMGSNDATSASRTHAFRVIQLDLNLNRPASALRFLKLCDNPLETFSTAAIHTLVITQYAQWTDRQQCFALEKLWQWRSSDGRRTLSTVLPNTRCLHLHHLDWDSHTRLPTEIFGSVKELYLYYVDFTTYDGFLNLLGSIKSLQSIEMTGCPSRGGPLAQADTGGFRQSSQQPAADPSTLQTISIHSVKDAKLVELLVPSPNLRSLRVTSHSGRHESHVMSVVRRLMASARRSLTTVKLDLTGSRSIEEFSSSFRDDPLMEYPNLRELELLVAGQELISLLAAINGNAGASPSPLRVLKIPSLSTMRLSLSDWITLDGILQGPYFSSVKELVTNFYVTFRSTDVTRQSKAPSYSTPDPCSYPESALQSAILRLQEHLPRCFDRGIIAPRIDYAYIPDPPLYRLRPSPVENRTDFDVALAALLPDATKFGKLKAFITRILSPFHRFR
ncbi:carboxypeptidase Y-deficient [Marasmius crinis-equi]|uniref:Carboxypeptidase Y-deficient n=1 Tax=Marasmius crinis-equi TaxID=585013 RepID=A0ABR3FYJ9_9AGAR